MPLNGDHRGPAIAGYAVPNRTPRSRRADPTVNSVIHVEWLSSSAVQHLEAYPFINPSDDEIATAAGANKTILVTIPKVDAERIAEAFNTYRTVVLAVLGYQWRSKIEEAVYNGIKASIEHLNLTCKHAGVLWHDHIYAYNNPMLRPMTEHSLFLLLRRFYLGAKEARDFISEVSAKPQALRTEAGIITNVTYSRVTTTQSLMELLATRDEILVTGATGDRQALGTYDGALSIYE